MIKFNIAASSNPANTFTQALAQIPALLDLVAAKFNSVMQSKNVTIDLKLDVDPNVAGAMASSPISLPNGVKTIRTAVATEIQDGIDVNSAEIDGTLTLSTTFLEKLQTYGHESTNPNAWPITMILVHEVLHMMGVSGLRDRVTGELKFSAQTPFDSFVAIKEGKPYFVGPNATSLLGAAVPLTALNNGSSIYHIDSDHFPDLPVDVLNPSFRDNVQLSDLDLAIMKDLGYEISKLLTTPDGKTFLPSAVADRIHGQSSMDTAIYSGVKASYRVDAFGNQTANVHRALNTADSDTLVGVERIKFADATLAFDTNGAVGEVYRLYQAAFDRNPDKEGLGYWIKARESGVNHNVVASSFIGSSEFQNLYGSSVSSTDFVTRLYGNVLDRAPDSFGLNYWVAMLDNKLLTRDQVLISFAESNENRVRTILDADSTDAQAYRLYKAAFDRAPDIGGLVYWAGQMHFGLTLKQVAHNFLQSDEFRKLYGDVTSTAQFVTLLYNNVLDRAPDAAGKAYWSELLDNNKLNRADVLAEFSESVENRVSLIGQGLMRDYVEFV